MINIKFNERYTKLLINDQKIIEEYKNELLLVGQKDKIYLKSPEKIIMKDNYIINK